MTDTKKCPKCGKQLHTDAQYCMYCMHSFQEKKDVTPTGLNRRGKQLLYWIPVVIAAAVLLSLFIPFFLNDPAKDDDPRLSQISGQVHSPETTNNNETPAAEEQQPTKQEGAQSNFPQSTTGQTITPGKETGPLLPAPSEPDVSQPPVSEPTESEQKPTEVPPISTDPEVTTPPCSHYYMEATCNAPMTCTYCGDTWGSVDQNAHNWVADKVTVHHNEVGHYEEQTDYVKKTKYLCFFCGYSQAGFDSMEEVMEHTPVHSGSSGYDAALPWLDSLIETREVWEEVPVQVWVVDQKAYDETVITGYTCAVCNSKKDA